ncbi:MAG: DNA-3-methyladenine glycosylase [Candidatus Woesearchaeota archaeon]
MFEEGMYGNFEINQKIKLALKMKPLFPLFFARNTLIVAKELLGKIIEVNGCRARIVEVEAYKDDEASHAFTKTDRSVLMYDTFSHVYVYLIYGMYNCLNFTTEKNGIPGAVLIRGLEPLSGIEKMQKRRNTLEIKNLCSGPGKLCQALGIDKKFNESKMGDKLKVFDDGFVVNKIGKSKRVGISVATHLEWRFFIEGNKFVSKH